jgi:cytochrome c-type biogenesis protein CcmH/NrfG
VTAFWVIAALLAASALAFVLPPLLRSRRTAPGAAIDATNVAVYRDQLRELDRSRPGRGPCTRRGASSRRVSTTSGLRSRPAP